ncbi:hypothetical protein A2U01_0055255 [Trifolium medium]|uniref:Uncharacterized protein n=1 Tax=Trifolium medium TaxID=97028 RepID=A0A392RCW4_9FABA|nr:hypothetical protein [Trifolium medium]
MKVRYVYRDSCVVSWPSLWVGIGHPGSMRISERCRFSAAASVSQPLLFVLSPGHICLLRFCNVAPKLKVEDDDKNFWVKLSTLGAIVYNSSI